MYLIHLKYFVVQWPWWVLMKKTIVFNVHDTMKNFSTNICWSMYKELWHIITWQQNPVISVSLHSPNHFVQPLVVPAKGISFSVLWYLSLYIYVLVQNIHRCQNHPYYRRKRPFPAQIRRLPQVLYCIPAPVVGGIFVILLPTSIPSLIYSAHAVHLIIFVQMNSCLPPKVYYPVSLSHCPLPEKRAGLGKG